ncbi:MAG: PIN domain-containing protein [Deferribacteraceae bacterium]|jgi:predicted nucleic acid-binding protein|nr:PIN domain-containing protein [Deferribacteraceae bacterium]
MQDRVFIDTNIFFYLYSTDEVEKRTKIEEVTEQYSCITSTQAINEFSNILIKKLKLPVEQIKSVIAEIYSFCNVIEIELPIIEQALDIHEMYKYSYYDCLMLSAALTSRCTQIFTEDMQDGQIIKNRLTIKNIL